MAFSVVETHIANPAQTVRRKGTRKNMAKARRKMSAKQIRIFGTKRQKAALKAKRRHAPAKKRSNPRGSFRKFKKLLKRGSKAKMRRSDWREVRGILGSDAGRKVRKKSNASRRKTRRH